MSQINQAKIKPGRAISRIWIIPVIAALTGLWMIYDYIDSKGVSITIMMPDAEGVNVGKTLIKTRSVPIGVVSEVRLARNLQQVQVTAEIEKPYLNLLKSDSLIWSVQPRINESGISGLSTILSGIYFEFQPGSSDKTTRQFNLIPTPPLVSKNVKGRRFKLYSQSADVLQVGSPVLFKGVKVGSIETADFDWYTETMYYQIFIQSPNFNLVTENSLFWVETGVELDLSADGINFKSGSLTKLLGGAITFGRPPREPKGDVAQADRQFALSSSYKESLQQRYRDFEYYVVLLDDSVRGLKPEAPIEYRGIRIGSVEEVPVMLETHGKPYFMTKSNKSIAVLIKIEFARIYRDTALAREFWESNLDQWIDDGMRLSIKQAICSPAQSFWKLVFFQSLTTMFPGPLQITR